jgi:PTS system ascorbate-specific IIA component
VKRTVTDWEEAVRIGGGLMVDAGLVEPRYIDTIVSNHKEMGPYFVVAPGIAMPHAKPENGVLKTGYAVMTLASPVEFGDEENDPVDILIFAGAVDREEHNQEAVPQIAELCDSDRFIDALRTAQDQAEVFTVLDEFERALNAGELE